MPREGRRDPSGRSFAAVTCVLLLLAACTGGGGPSTTPRAMPHLGGTLRVATGDFTLRLDPQARYDTGAFELFQCCLLRTLLSYAGRPTQQGGATLLPDLATALPRVSPSGLEWTFHIKPGLHYAPPLQHTEIVAQDFIRALERDAKVASGPPNGPGY